MSWLGNIKSSFEKWATDQINSLASRVTTAEGKQIITKEYVSTEQSVSASGLLTLSHGLGARPKYITAELVCKVADLGWSVGDIVVVPAVPFSSDGANGYGFQCGLDSTNLTIRYGTAGTFYLQNKTTGAVSTALSSSWRLVVRAYV